MGTMNKLTKIVLSFLMVITCINFSTVQAEDGEETNYSEPTTVETVSEDPANEVEQEVAQEEPAVEEEAPVEEAPAEQPAEEAAPVEEPQQEEIAPEASEETQVEEVNNAPEEAASEEATVAAEPQLEETTVAPEEPQEEAVEEPAEVQKATVEISYVDEEDKEIADKVSDKEFDVDFVVTADDKEVYKDIDGYTFKEAIVNDDAENRTFTADTIKLDGLKVTSDMNKVKLVYSKNPVATKKDTTVKETPKKSSGLLGALENAVDTLTEKTEEASDDADPLSVASTTITVNVNRKTKLTGKRSWYSNHTWSTDNNDVVEITEENGREATIKGINPGTATVTHTYGNGYVDTWTVTVPVIGRVNASVFFLNDPNEDAGSNGTGMWYPSNGESNLTAVLDLTNARFNGEKNLFHVDPFVVSWPDGSTGPSWVLPATNAYWDLTFNAYKSKVEHDLGVSILKNDVTKIVLHPHKISDNTSGYHLDCNVEVVCRKVITAAFKVKDVNSDIFVNVSSTNYKTDVNGNVSIPMFSQPATKTVGGKTYTFQGWYTDEKCTNLVTEWPTTTKENVNYYGKYVGEYTVSYVANGGTFAEGTTIKSTQLEGSQFTLAAAPTREGYKFQGWKLDNTNYDAGTTYTMPARDIKFEAQWVSSAFTVDKPNDVVYNGNSQQLEPVVKDANNNKITLKKDTDYKVSYSEDTTNVGTVTVTITGIGNYTGEFKNTTYQITRKSVTVTARSYSKKFGESDPIFEADTAGTLNGDKITYNISREDGANVGNYALTPVGETVQGNYTVTYKPGKLTITAGSRPADKQLGVTPYEGVYDANEHTITVNNVLDGDKVEYSYDGGKTWEGKLKKYRNVESASIQVKVTNKNYIPDEKILNGTVTITRFPLVVKAEDKTKVFGEKDPKLTATEISGVEGKAKPDDQKIKYSLSRTTGENVGDYTITPSGEAVQGNYTVTYNPGKLTITAAARPEDKKLYVTSYEGEYDAGFHTITVNNVLAGDVVQYSYDNGTTWTTKLNQYKDVTETTILVKVTNANYDPNPVELDGTVKITSKPVTVTARSYSKKFGESDPIFEADTAGTLNGDKITYNISREDGANVGNYALTPVGETVQGNYTVTYKPGKLTITASDREKTVEVASYNGVYDAKNHTIEVKNLVKGDHVQYSYDGGTIWEDTLNQYKDVTETEILVKVTNANYADVPQLTGNVTITRFPLVVKAEDKTKVFGEKDPKLTATEISGVEGKAKPDDQKIKYSLSRTTGENVGDYTITPSGEAVQGNYTVTYNPGKLTITKASRAKDIEVVNYKDDYDANEHTITVNNVLDGDKVEYSYDNGTTWTTELNQYKDVTAEVKIQVKVTNDNYKPVDTKTGSVEITRKSVTVTARSYSKKFGESDPIFEADTAGTLNGDKITYNISREDGANVGNYALTPVGETVQGNYTVTYKPGKLTIMQSNELSIEVNAESADKSKVYDGTALVVGAEADPAEGTKVEYSTDGGKTWTTEIPSIKNAGTVHVKARATNSNYSNIPEVEYDLTVTRRPVTLTSATDSKTYDGTPLTNENVSVSGDGFAESEGATFAVTGTITNVGTKANTFGYALNKNTLASNYNISTELGTLTITPKTITPDDKKTGITVENPGNVKYDGKDHAEKPVIKDEKTGVTLEEGKDYEIVYPEDIRNAGEITATVVGKGDYEGSFEIKYNITKRDVTFTSATDSKQYDGNALTNGNVEITGDGFIEGEGATFNVTGSITDVGSTNNAFTYAMNEGTNADNYNVTVVEGTLTVSEQPVVPTPATPTTPSNNTPARTNNVPARVVTNPTTTTPAPEATVEPAKVEPTPAPTAKPEKIKEEVTPQAAPKGHWALINLIAAMLSVVLAVVALLAKHAKDEDEDDEDKDDQVVANENEDDDENESTRHRRWKVIATIDAILAVVVFILTENISLPMVLVDKWTLLMVLFGLISIVSTYFARKWHEEDEDEDEESSQNA